MHKGAGRPQRVATTAVAYCATDAVAAKEMSIPPATSTTNTPIARIAVTE
jgi:hypothetical protein